MGVYACVYVFTYVHGYIYISHYMHMYSYTCMCHIRILALCVWCTITCNYIRSYYVCNSFCLCQFETKYTKNFYFFFCMYLGAYRCMCVHRLGAHSLLAPNVSSLPQWASFQAIGTWLWYPGLPPELVSITFSPFAFHIPVVFYSLFFTCHWISFLFLL